MLDDVRDLLLGSSCVGCGRPGRLWCAACRGGLVPAPAPAWPSPVPPGLTRPWAATSYDGPVRELVLGHKERRLLALARPLGELLAEAVVAALGAVAGAGERLAPGPLLLVPVPSRASSVRARGHDPTASLVRVAARALASRGCPVRCAALLRARPGLVDQAGLDAAARARNLAAAFRVHPPTLRRLAGCGVAVHLVVCDDVLTTGATAAEAQRALRAVGLPALAAVAVAATPRRTPLRAAGGPGPAVP